MTSLIDWISRSSSMGWLAEGVAVWQFLLFVSSCLFNSIFLCIFWPLRARVLIGAVGVTFGRHCGDTERPGVPSSTSTGAEIAVCGRGKGFRDQRW